MKMKKVLALCMLATALLAAGCSNNKKADETEAVTEEAAGTSQAVDIEIEEYDALEYVTLGDYKGLTVTKPVFTVTKDDLEMELSGRLSDQLVDVEDRAVENGDFVVIDYVGTKDGVAFDGGTAEDYTLEIGSGSFIDGFEEGLVGAELGENLDLDLTFPEEYNAEDLAGADVVFNVTVKGIQTVPELTDDIVAEMSETAKTVDEYKAEVEQELIEAQEETYEYTKVNELWEQVFENCTVEGYPQTLFDYEMEVSNQYYADMAVQYEMELEDLVTSYYGVSLEEFEQTNMESVEAYIQQILVFEAIAAVEGLEPSEAELQEEYQSMADLYTEGDVDSLLEYYGENVIQYQILYDRISDLILENCVEVQETEAETTASDDEDAEEDTDAEAETKEEDTEDDKKEDDQTEADTKDGDDE